MADDPKMDVLHCCTCGIRFGLDSAVALLWQRQQKTFVCPNGHCLKHEDKLAESQALEALRAEVKELTAKLAAALIAAENQRLRADELASELEIWHPTDRSAQGD